MLQGIQEPLRSRTSIEDGAYLFLYGAPHVVEASLDAF